MWGFRLWKDNNKRLINGLIPHFYEGEYSGNVSVYGMNVQSEELYNISKKVGSVFQN